MTAGGRRFKFRAVVVAGDRKGRVGIGVAKSNDIPLAIQKAFGRAKQRAVKLEFTKGTIPFAIEKKYRSSRILLKPAPVGTGLIAGGPVRILCELAGIKNITAKVLSRSRNKLNIAEGALKALTDIDQAAKIRQKSAAESKVKN